MSEITFRFGVQVLSGGKASKQACSVLHNSFGNVAAARKMPPNGNVISDTLLNGSGYKIISMKVLSSVYKTFQERVT